MRVQERLRIFLKGEGALLMKILLMPEVLVM